MPLLDHFHPPLSERRQWNSFHHAWAVAISFELNRQLPEGYFADPTIKFDIPAAPTMTMPMTLITDVIAVDVFNREAGPVLVGAIELVSPANKDRPATRDAFVSKCASCLQQAIGLIVIDIVTERKADLHTELLHRLNETANPPRSELWAASYRPWQLGKTPNLEIWHHPLALGGALPVLPFWLKDGPCVRLDLEAIYMRTLADQRMLGPTNGQASA